jgi:SNF2 family DNA or RNA helicase
MTIPYLNSFTKIFSKEINLVKPIQDKNIRLVFGFCKRIFIVDKDDLSETHNNHMYINFLNIPKTEYFDQVINFYPYNMDYITYPYLDYVSEEDMKKEPIDAIKRYNYFIKDLPNNYTKSIIIAKLERVVVAGIDTYYMNYYMNNSIMRSIRNGKHLHFRANLLIKILMEQKTIDVLSQTENSLKMILSNVPERLENDFNQDLLKTGVELYQYQKNDILWMKSIETDVFNGDNSITYDYCMAFKSLNDEFLLYKDSLYSGNTNIDNYKLQVQFNYRGGNLISEMGLGKSLIMLYHILEENKKTQDFYNPYVEFSDNCNYFYKRGKNRGDNCLKRRVNDLYCKEHSKSIFIDKRSLKFCNLQNFDIRNYIYVVDDNEFIKTNASIIICPNHLCDQWVQEYYSKFNNNHRVVLIVTGDQYSNITFGDLLFADIVVISYNFLLNKIFNTVYEGKLDFDFSKRGFTLNEEMTLKKKQDLLMSKELTLLHLFYWNRVILDEVHEIQNMQKANFLKGKISNLSSMYKWNISGTPFANNVTSFINLMSYNTDYGKAYYYDFDNCIYRNEHVNLKNLLEFGLDSDIINKCKFLFRRNTKLSIKDEYNKSIIKQDVHLLNFTSQERSIYDSYVQESNRHLNFLIKLCCHPELNHDTKEMIRNCKTFDEIQKCMLDYNKKLLEDECNKITTLEIEIDYYETQLIEDPQVEVDAIKCKLNISKRQYTIHKKSRDDISRTYNYLKNSIDKLKDSSSELTCPICLDDIDVNNIVITKCGHKFCWDCLYETHKIRKDTIIKCPTCNLCMKNDEVYLLKDDKTNHDEMSDLEKIIERVRSTKIGNIIYYLKNSIEKDDKVILFSQWDEMLHKVGDLLKDTGINIVYCNGSVYQRKRAITNFTKKDDVNIILLSSRNAASGINLTVSNKIIFLEPIYGTKDYRTSIESQAIGRADRIGQKRPIEIHRFLIKQTVEEEIYDDLIDDTKLKQLNMK